MNDGLRFANDYANATTVHPLGLAILIICCALLFVLPRRWMIAPLLALACFVPPGQRVVLASLDFTFLRIIGLTAIAAAVARGMHRQFRIAPLDYLVVGWVGLTILMPLLREVLPPVEVVGVQPSANAARLNFVYYLGIGLDWLAGYFAFRLLVSDWADATRLAITLLMLAIPVTIAFAIEWTTQRNMFSAFGGVPEITVSRSGRLRCQGAFAHPILAGCFWATVFPIVASLFAFPNWRSLALIGMGCSLAIVFASASSTPLIAVVIALIGMATFSYRRVVGVALLSIMFGLGMFILTVPNGLKVLLTQVQFVAGSTGYHRYNLIMGASRHFNEWWLAGSNLGTEHWGRQLFDVTNFFIAQSLQGGLVLLIVFTAVNVVSVMVAARTCRLPDLLPKRRWLMWMLGVAVLQHAISLTAVSYYGQIWMLWFGTIAVVASMSVQPVEVPQTKFAEEEAYEDDEEAIYIDPRRPRLATR